MTDMIKMDALDPANALNMPELADMSLATDFLLRTKESVRNTAAALTETVTPESRALLREMLTESIALHQEIADLMARKKWIHQYHMDEQFKLDWLSADNTMELMKQKLFPDDTSRKGMFDRTPDAHKGGHEA